MTPEELKGRTKAFAVRIIKAVETIPHTIAGREITRQLVRAAGSIGANYRAACRARSKAEFLAKMQIVREEADECVYWIEVLFESNLVHNQAWSDLQKEANELTAIFTSSLATARGLR